MSSTELTAPAGSLDWGRRPAMDEIDQRLLSLIRSTAFKGLNDAECGQALELARGLDLNPLAQEIWASAYTRNGGDRHVLIMVGRDGLLKNANRYGDYRGYDSDVIHAQDDFRRVPPKPESKSLRERAGVSHTYGLPAERGEIVGAWCAAERAGRPPRFFLALLSEYMPPPGNKRDKSPWGSQTSVMIEKVAISVVHKTLCSITGVYVEEEVDRLRRADAEGTAEEVPGPDFGGDAVGARIKAAAERIWAADPSLLPPARLEMMLPGLTEEGRAQLADELERQAGSLPEGPAAQEEERAVLARRREDLERRLERTVPGSDEAAELALELDLVIEKLGGSAPGQGELDIKL